MDMCYDGALVMPSSYAVMDEEEMTYIEGGGTSRVFSASRALSYLTRQAALCAADCIGGLVVAGVGAATIVLGIAGGIIATWMGQWAGAYANARTQVKQECDRRGGNQRWSVGIKEDIFLGFLTVTLW